MMALVRGANQSQQFVAGIKRQKPAMRKKIVRDEINETVNGDSKPDGESIPTAENHQSDGDEREKQTENIVRLENSVMRFVVRNVNFPQNPVKQKAMDEIRKYLHSGETEKNQSDFYDHDFLP